MVLTVNVVSSIGGCGGCFSNIKVAAFNVKVVPGKVITAAGVGAVTQSVQVVLKLV